jgi:hypothetical protein
MSTAKYVFLALAVCCFVGPAWARREPLNQVEIDQLRDVAQMPEKRIGLYVKFIRARGESLAQLASDPRYTEDRSAQIHDLLEDITLLLDEMDDNIDGYADKADLRKALKEAMAMDTELESKLKAMNQRAAQPEHNANPKSYALVLDDALEAVTGSLDHARKVMAEQEERAKEKSKK